MALNPEQHNHIEMQFVVVLIHLESCLVITCEKWLVTVSMKILNPDVLELLQ